jgi:hypothetical protein
LSRLPSFGARPSPAGRRRRDRPSHYSLECDCVFPRPVNQRSAQPHHDGNRHARRPIDRRIPNRQIGLRQDFGGRPGPRQTADQPVEGCSGLRRGHSLAQKVLLWTQTSEETRNEQVIRTLYSLALRPSSTPRRYPRYKSQWFHHALAGANAASIARAPRCVTASMHSEPQIFVLTAEPIPARGRTGLARSSMQRARSLIDTPGRSMQARQCD